MGKKRTWDFLTSSIAGQQEEILQEEKYRAVFLHILTACYILFNIIITFSSIIFNDDLLLINWINAPAVVILLLINSLLFLRKRNLRLYILFFLGVSILDLVYSLFIMTDVSIWPLLWCLILPILAIYLLELKWGSRLVLVLFLFISGFLIFNTAYREYHHITSFFLISFLLTFLFLWAISSFFMFYIRRSMYQLRKANTLISKAIENRESFLAELSHQIRTPLNDIMAFNEMINTIDIPEENREIFEMVRASSQNLIHAVGSFNRLGKFSYEKKKISQITFDIVHHLSQLEKSINRQNKDKMQFSIQTKGYLPNQVNGDPVILDQIILSLVEGLLRNTVPNKILEIKINAEFKSEADQILFTGMITSAPPPPFDPDKYMQLREMVETGVNAITSNDELPYLNLLLAMDLCKQLNGDLTLSHEKEQPVKITFNLPFTEIQLTTRTPVTLTEEVTPVSTTSLSESNILLVEDNPINQKIVMASLKPHVRNIDLAEDGKKALDFYGKHRYDFILMDIQIPIMDGMLVTKKIREIEVSTNTHTPIIAITANAMPGDRETCLSAGMDEYLSKPFMINQLLDKMKSLLR